MNFIKKNRLVIYILLLSCFFNTITDGAFSAESAATQARQAGDETSPKTWWNEWEGFIKMMDQSTQPAPDFIPYNRIKYSVYQNAIVPTQNAYNKLTGNEPASKPTGLQKYQPKPPQVQAAERQQTAVRFKNQSHTNPRNAATTDDLADLPNDSEPRAPGNIAPQSDWQKIPGEKTGPSFYERNLPKVKKMLADDPKNHTGSLKILETLQTMQMLIKCKEQGFTAKQCASMYIQNFATGKAVSELLQLLGASSVAVYGSLVYADYVAIQNISKMIKIHQAMLEDAERNRKQALENDIVNYAHWNGEIDSLQKILEIFLQQYTSRQNPLSRELLDAWARSDKLIEQVKEKRSALTRAIADYQESGKFEEQLLASCPRENEQAIQGDVNSDCREIITNALNKFAPPLQETYNASDLIRQYQEDCKNKADAEMNTCSESREKILQQSNDAALLQKPALEFKLAYENCVTAVLMARGLLEQYKTNKTAFENRKARLVQFLRPQAQEMLRMREKELSQALRMIEDMKRSLTEYKPKPSYFDSSDGYQLSIDAMISDLKFMRDIPEKLVTSIKEKTARLEKSFPSPKAKIDCRQADRLETCLNKCETMEAMYRSELETEEYRAAQGTLKSLQNRGCPYSEELKVMVPAPDITWLAYEEALPKVQKSGLRIVIDYSGKTPDHEESQYIYGQSPGVGAKVEMNSIITAHCKRYDPNAAPTDCMKFKEIYRQAIVRKDPQFKLAEGIMTQSEKLHCYWVDKARGHLAETRTQYEKFKTEQKTRCADLKARYQGAMTSTEPAFAVGKNLLTQAVACDWAERAQKHYEQVTRSWEEKQQETFCSELKKSYQEAMANKDTPPDFTEGKRILDKTKQCVWTDRAHAHYTQSQKKYDQYQLVQEQRRISQYCEDLRSKFNTEIEKAQQTGNISKLQFFLSSSQKCDWHSNGASMVACIEGEYKGLYAFKMGDTETASYWAGWGNEKGCYYVDKLTSLVNNKKDQHSKQKYCDQLADKFNNALKRADKTMDTSELKSILTSAGGCSWQKAASAALPCVEGEYNAVRSYNSGDLTTASSWTEWGKTKSCLYTNRLQGLIADRMAQLQKQQAAKQLTQERYTGQNAPRAVSRNRQTLTRRTATNPSSLSCAEMNAMALAACQQNNAGSLDHLESRWNALGCQPNAALGACYDAWFDREFKPLEQSLMRLRQ